jgi:transposase
VRCAGVEGTSSYGAGLARHLKARGIEVLEVERPKRQRRSSRRKAKSDLSDADSAATLLIVAGDNPQRLGSDASFANLCGVSPIEASSGKVVRHRLNRGGNREANRALYMICLARMRRDPRTQEYVARRTTEGKSKREIIRCLKRYVAREV